MKIKLEVKEKLVLIQLFPQGASYMEAVLMKDIQAKTELTQEELKKIKFKKTSPNSFRWDTQIEKEIIKEIDYTDLEYKFLLEQVTRLDKEKKITLNNLSLCTKIKEAKEATHGS